MKNNIYINKINTLTLRLVIIILFGLLSYSCKDDILNIKPIGNISEKDIFSDKNLLEYYVNGRYVAFDQYNFGVQNTDPMTDDATSNPGSGVGNTNAVNYTDGLTSPTTIPYNKWDGNYANIRDINFFFSRISTATNIDAADIKRLTGEMRFIRAWLYLQLVSVYGDVILISDLPTLNQENYDKAKTPYHEVVDYIVKELDLAIDELPDITFNGRASKGAAMALKARTLLYVASPLHNNGTYDNAKLTLARDVAQQVIDLGKYSLESDFADIYKYTGGYSNEIIFARIFNEEHKAINFFFFGVTSPDRYYLPLAYQDVDTNWIYPIQSLVDAFEMANGMPITDTASGYNAQNPYEGRDPRLSKTIIHQGSVLTGLDGNPLTITFHSNNDATDTNPAHSNGNSYTSLTYSNYGIRKRADPGKPMRGGRANYTPWIFIRLAEMYLIIAEAEAEQGNSAPAITNLNIVRNRAGMPNLPTGLTGEALRSRYRNERRVEYALENMRWFDIVRWKIGNEVIATPSEGIDIKRDYTQDPPVDIYSKKTLYGTRAWNDKQYFLPIADSELQANKKLTQNEGY